MPSPWATGGPHSVSRFVMGFSLDASSLVASRDNLLASKPPKSRPDPRRPVALPTTEFLEPLKLDESVVLDDIF